MVGADVDMRRMREETRRLLLDVAARMVRDRDRADTMDVSLGSVIDRVGLNSDVAYTIWTSQADFNADLALHIVTGDGPIDLDPPPVDVEAILADPACSPAEAIHRLGRCHLVWFLDREDLHLQLNLWASRHPAGDLARPVDRRDEPHRQLIGALSRVLDHHGAFDPASDAIRNLSVTATALTEGYALRHRLDRSGHRPSTELIEDYASELVGLVNGFVGMSARA